MSKSIWSLSAAVAAAATTVEDEDDMLKVFTAAAAAAAVVTTNDEDFEATVLDISPTAATGLEKELIPLLGLNSFQVPMKYKSSKFQRVNNVLTNKKLEQINIGKLSLSS